MRLFSVVIQYGVLWLFSEDETHRNGVRCRSASMYSGLQVCEQNCCCHTWPIQIVLSVGGWRLSVPKRERAPLPACMPKDGALSNSDLGGLLFSLGGLLPGLGGLVLILAGLLRGLLPGLGGLLFRRGGLLMTLEGLLAGLVGLLASLRGLLISLGGLLPSLKGLLPSLEGLLPSLGGLRATRGGLLPSGGLLSVGTMCSHIMSCLCGMPRRAHLGLT